jgi:hypothetical protein
MTDPLSIVPPKKKPLHVVIPRKQHIIRVDSVNDAEAYNKCDQIPLFTDFIKQIGVMEKNQPKDILPWEQKGVKWKTITAEAGTNN